MSAGDAVRIAAKVGEIGFPEFTAKLVTDTFDALISANIQQTESYVELLTNVSKDLRSFIDGTKDDISGSMVLDYLIKILPTKSGTGVAVGQPLTATNATKLNDALLINDASGTNIQTTNFAASTNISQNNYKAILDAVAMRLSANKYDALQQMVKMGMLRLVVEKGLIETRLTFNTSGYDYAASTSSLYATATSRTTSRPGILQTIIRGPSATASTRLTVVTASQSQFSSTASSVQIFGMVQLNFKTDYMPLGS